MWSFPVMVTSGPVGLVTEASATVTHSFTGGGAAGLSSAFMAVTVAVIVPVTGAAVTQITAPTRAAATIVEATRRSRRRELGPANGMDAPSAAYSLVILNRSMSHQ